MIVDLDCQKPLIFLMRDHKNLKQTRTNEF